MRIVTLLSDFGLGDGYVAQMKAVVLESCPDAVIVDISHGVERHNIAMGSFILETTVPYFPKGTTHVAVVDPGVGSSRKAIVVKCEKALLVGPDNGLMARASERLGLVSIHQIREPEFQRMPGSNTFQGRDIFAHVAGLLASGRRAAEVGPRISELEKLHLSLPKLSGRRLTCHVLHIDTFGNVITDVDEGLLRRVPVNLGERIEVQTKTGKMQSRYSRSYHEVRQGDLAVLPGSQGFLEIAVREGSAKDKLGVKPLDALELRF